jgi:hypothetical protein
MWSSRWNENWQGKLKYWEKTCPSATLSTTNPTWPDLGSNPGRRGGKPATNRLSYDTARLPAFDKMVSGSTSVFFCVCVVVKRQSNSEHQSNLHRSYLTCSLAGRLWSYSSLAPHLTLWAKFEISCSLVSCHERLCGTIIYMTSTNIVLQTTKYPKYKFTTDVV